MVQHHHPHPGADGPAHGGASQPSQRDPWIGLTQVLDAECLERLYELDPNGATDLVLRVLRAFDTSVERLLAQLVQARAEDDHKGMRHVAHTIKSSAASIGALELSRICADIESKVREQQSEGLPALLDDMVAQAGRVRAVLKPVLDLPR